MSDHSGSAPQHTNRLIKEKSPYLLQHAHNPVDWYPWGPEALEAARQSDRPIFLSVGYSACHWCHVMERESFEDENIGQLLNQHFISIKVDREERPDIDEIYMTAVQMMTRHGGWPMSVFLLPDGRPFYGGTYFPPDSQHGRIGFRQLISQLAEAYGNRREEVEQVANSITEELRHATRQRPLSAPPGPPQAEALIQMAVADLEKRFDRANGGFGDAPKFPPHHALRLLCEVDSDGKERMMLYATLEQMALGGIYDHIGGGFHRYSTDAVWLLPHFEKMLYDNALLARVYSSAYLLDQREAFARIARETCEWVLRDMADPGGGFYAALDADSEGEEGKFYVWTPEEVKAVLGEAEGEAFCYRYHILPGGNFLEEATGRDTGQSVPFLAVGDAQAALPETLDPEEVAGRARLLAKRYERTPPGKDNKVITSWNGLMIGGLALTGKALGEARYLEAAAQAANFCLTTLRPGGKLLRRYAGGEAGLPAFLDDYAYLADGLLDLYDATGEPRWADAARELADTLLADFWDPEEGGFFFAGSEHETLIARSKDLFDGALPSANGVAARAMTRLGQLPGGEVYARKASELLMAYRGVMHRAPGGTLTLILAARTAFPRSDGVVGMASEGGEEPLLLVGGSETLIARPGESVEAVFTLKIGADYHINARNPERDHLIPTAVTFATDAPASVGPVAYPPAVSYEAMGETLRVYQGSVSFRVPVLLAEDALPGEYMLRVTVHCQPCTDSSCLAPVELEGRVVLAVGG